MPSKEEYWKYHAYYLREKAKHYVKYRDKIRAYYKEWYAKNGRDRSIKERQITREWRENNPEKYQASCMVRMAVKKGELIKPLDCFKCKRQVKLIGHHTDYTKPLDVVWLCYSCHKLIHLGGP